MADEKKYGTKFSSKPGQKIKKIPGLSLWETVAGTTGVPTKKDLEREKIKKLNKRKKARLGATAKDGGMIRKYAHGGEATVKGRAQTGGVKKIQISGKHWNKNIG